MLILRLVTSVLALQTVLGGSFECNGDHIMLVHVYWGAERYRRYSHAYAKQPVVSLGHIMNI
jgi:hypothetical protein